VVQTTGTTIDDFYIPPFTVDKGDIVVVQLPNGPYFYGLLLILVDILTGKTKNDTVDLKDEFRFVEHIKESRWTSIVYPLTVERYIKKYGNPDSDVAKRIYEIDGIKPNIRINTLPGTPRKLLSLLTTFSWTDKIVFDLAGIDPTGGQRTFDLVKSQVDNSGAAILIDSYDDFKNDCSKFVKFELVSSRN
jgi:hypothetical protein